VATVLIDAGLDPTVIIGGRLHSLGSNAKLGQGEYLVAEADESDGSFLLLSPTIGVVTTVDAEHLDFYGDLEAVQKAFSQFINQVPFYGCSVICLDQPHIQSLVPQLHRRLITYGLTRQADYVARDLRFVGLRSHFDVFQTDQWLGQFSLNLPGTQRLQRPGRHCDRYGTGRAITDDHHSFEEFSGVQRRFDRRGAT
jgi:UDP-N-acetylmuramate--alanine ligase